MEEELLLVDAESGHPRAVSEQVLQRPEVRASGDAPHSEQAPGGSLEAEFQQQQLETGTRPHVDMASLEADVRRWRGKAIAGAAAAGARVVASGTSPMPVQPELVPKPRYENIAQRYGLTASEQLCCGLHVHVSVVSPDEAIGALDRLRVWLPALLALSANSPFWQGADSRYASYRSQAMVRWPTAGPHDVFGSANGYRRLVSDMVNTGVILDEGMIYFDARPSHHYPTVEIRVADVCLDAQDTVLVAALARGLVETGARDWGSGAPPADVPTALLRLATWQAGRDGVDGSLLDPRTNLPRHAREVLAEMVDRVRPALRASGDDELVDERLAYVLRRGTGANRQRAVLQRTGDLAEVVADLARVTAGETH